MASAVAVLSMAAGIFSFRGRSERQRVVTTDSESDEEIITQTDEAAGGSLQYHIPDYSTILDHHPSGTEMVGLRIMVAWPTESRVSGKWQRTKHWFSGTIKSYRPHTKEHVICFDGKRSKAYKLNPLAYSTAQNAPAMSWFLYR